LFEPSIFLKETELPFPIPLLAFEILFKEFDNLPSEEESLIAACYHKSLLLGCGIEEITNEHIKYFSERVLALKAEFEKPSEGVNTQPASKGFYSDYISYVSELDTSVSALISTGFDYHKAKYLYTEVDRGIALEIIKASHTHTSRLSRVQLEACVYGFGGEMSGGSSESAKVHDISTAQGKASLKSMGF